MSQVGTCRITFNDLTLKLGAASTDAPSPSQPPASTPDYCSSLEQHLTIRPSTYARGFCDVQLRMRPEIYLTSGEQPFTQTVVASVTDWQPRPLHPTAVGADGGGEGTFGASLAVPPGTTLWYRFTVNGAEYADACNAALPGDSASMVVATCTPLAPLAATDAADAGKNRESSSVVELFEWRHDDAAALQFQRTATGLSYSCWLRCSD